MSFSGLATPTQNVSPPASSPTSIHGPWTFLRRETETTSPRATSRRRTQQHLYVLPVLWLEFLALALTRAVLPSLLLQEYGSNVYVVLGFADCIRGLLAFVACPLFGKLSDYWGRRWCLLITVIGTCAPVCSLALFRWENTLEDPTTMSSFGRALSSPTLLDEGSGGEASPANAAFPLSSSTDYHSTLPPMAIPLFVVLLSLSGMFSSTFTLVFAYISDTVRRRDERVSAYGLALATLGLSFSIGPMAGGYLAKYNPQYVFICSLILTVLDVSYIYFILPESLPPEQLQQFQSNSISADASSVATATSTASWMMHLAGVEKLPNISWNPWNSVRLILRDPFLRIVGQVAFLYYTGLWAVFSTLSLYAVQRFHLSPERLGELMSALGLSTMIAEAILVRALVPRWGEKRATRLGLASFALQCFVLGLAREPWHLFVCVAFSLLGNLVYPSLTSLVSGTVEPKAVGEALGAVNGIKSLTEGIGPLVFGILMTWSGEETSPLVSTIVPGWPYWIAAALVVMAYRVAANLPDNSSDRYDTETDYIHELEFKERRKPPPTVQTPPSTRIIPEDPCAARVIAMANKAMTTPTRDDKEEEYEWLLHQLSEVEESPDERETDEATDTEEVEEAAPPPPVEKSSFFRFAMPRRK